MDHLYIVTNAPPIQAAFGVVNWLKIGENFVASLVTTGFILGMLNWYLAKKKAPMERADLLADASNTTVSSVLAALDRTEKQALRAERNANKALRQVAMLRTAYDALLMFWRHVAGNWEQFRHHEVPPVVPAHAIIDWAEWDAHDETPTNDGQ